MNLLVRKFRFLLLQEIEISVLRLGQFARRQSRGGGGMLSIYTFIYHNLVFQTLHFRSDWSTSDFSIFQSSTSFRPISCKSVVNPLQLY